MTSAKIDTARLLAALEKRRALLGELRGDDEPLTWTEVASQVGCHSATFSRLKGGTPPGEVVFHRILRWLGASDSDFAENPDEVVVIWGGGGAGEAGPELSFSITGDTTLPVGDRNAAWDGGAATARVFEAATSGDKVNVDFVSRAHLWKDPKFSDQEKQAYKLPFADIVDGRMLIFPKGVAAVAAGHGIAQADIPEEDKAKIKAKMCVIYDRIRAKYDDWPACPFENVSPKENDVSNSTDELAGAVPDKKVPAGKTPDGDPCSCDPEEDGYVEDCECADDTEQDCQACNEDEEHDSLKVAAIMGSGRLSESEDEKTKSLVSRVQELLREGAVGVSIKHDLDPDSMPPKETIAALLESGDLEELDKLMAGVSGRPRHVAVVDTAAFSDARLTLGEDGFSVEGPVTFEGIWTGDVRDLPFGGLVWENVLPIPITMGHEGPGGTQPEVIGYIDKLERVEGMSSGVRPEAVEDEDIEAVAAAAGGSDVLPAKFFAKFAANAETPLTISEPDANGLRHIYGHTVPHGVCHRSDMSPCFQYPGDVDPAHRGFHTGSVVQLDDGTSIRVGALTFGGPHVDVRLARQGVSYQNVGNHREDSNKVLALVHAWEDRYGLAVSGVVLPDISRADLLRVKALGPSVELWPKGSGRTLVGIHLVPTPAWPVAASAGSVEFQTMATAVQIEGDLDSEPEADPLADIRASLKRLETAIGMLAASALTDVPAPDAAVNE